MTRWSISFLAVLTTLAGCRPNYPKCDADSHCSEKGEVCVSGMCQQCRDDNQCKPGYECKSGTCISAADCKSGEACKDGKAPTECDDSRPCAAGATCQEGRCVSSPVSADIACDPQHPCPDGTTCEKNVCVVTKITQGSECLSTRDCGSGKQCSAGRCMTPNRCDLGTIPFDLDEYNLSEAARTQLERTAECLKDSVRTIIIEGHCDERGTDEYNLVLGNKRADAVRRYLLGLGVDESRVQITSFGREKPRNPGHDEAAWSENRRVEFVTR